MSDAKTTAIRGQWILGADESGPVVVRERWVVVEGDRIAAVSASRPAAVDHLVEMEQALVLPGLLNLHNHTTSSVLFRGLTEDLATTTFASELVYGLLLPLGDLATEKLSEAELAAVLRLGFLEIVKGGTTTLMEMFRNRQGVTFEVAREMGLRFYGAPYLFSSTVAEVDSKGAPVYEAGEGGAADLARCMALRERHDGAANGRIRFALGPHGADTCEPDLLREVRRSADALGCPITIHLAQSLPEIEVLERRHGKSPGEYLDDLGLLGPDLLAAHCIYADDADLARLKRRDTTVVNCPRTFARGGVTAPFHRFAERGLRTVVATDGYCMDLVGELRAAGLVSKLHAGRSGVSSARELLDAVTRRAAEALGRDDLGRISPGARADLVVVDMAKPHLQPVSDPLRTFAGNALGSDVAALMVDGRMLVEDARYLLADEREIVRAGAAAVQALWQTGEARAIIERARRGA